MLTKSPKGIIGMYKVIMAIIAEMKILALLSKILVRSLSLLY